MRAGVNLRRDHAPMWFIVAAIMLAGAGWIAYRNLGFARHAVRVEGVVTRSETVSSNSVGSHDTPSPRYRSIVTFTTAQGQRVEIAAHFSSTNPASVGTPVGVLYLPSAPQNAAIDSATERWGYVFLLGFFAVVVGAMGVVAQVFDPGRTERLQIDGQTWTADGQVPLPTTTVTFDVRQK